MLRLKFVALILLMHSILFGQIEKEVNKVLLQKNFSKLQNFLAEYKDEKNETKIYEGNMREIVQGYSEGVYTIQKGSKYNITTEPKLKLITNGNKIIYFHLATEDLRNLPHSLEISRDTVYEFADVEGIESLNELFRKTFHTELNENELFIDTIYYGKNCGCYGRFNPTEQLQINEWVRKRDTVNLSKWLVSTNAEKQVYAIQGFQRLSKGGTKMSMITSKYINYIARKKGTIKSCLNGGSDLQISDVVEELLKL